MVPIASAFLIVEYKDILSDCDEKHNIIISKFYYMLKVMDLNLNDDDLAYKLISKQCCWKKIHKIIIRAD